ncbi:MFS transporter [Anaerotignum sp.]
MTKQQKQVTWAMNIYVSSILMYYITQNVKAYIGISYPEIADVTVTSLITIPTMFALLFSFVIGPLAMRFDKVKLMTVVMCCMGAYSLIFFANGLLHGPFMLYVVACVLAGFAQGGFAPLMNTIIGENFESKDRAGRIAAYNVANNCGAFVILFLSGRIAAGNDGANWPFAYLLGLYCFVTTAIFLYMIKKAGYSDNKEARAARRAAAAESNQPAPKLSEVPKKALLFIIGIGLLHCVYYIGVNAYYTNVSNYIITEHQLGSSIQVGNATSLVRFTLIVMTFLYGFWNRILKDWMIPCGYALAAVGLVFMLKFNTSIMGIYACAFFIAFATSIAHSTIYSKALNYVPDSIAAISSSLMWGIANVGPFFATYVLAGISSALGGGMDTQIKAGIVILAVITVIAALIFVVNKPKEKTA